MPHIEQLSPHVADLIAAGEVVERPASVVKELMENAVDAGAGSVTVEIQHGGMTLIRVTDDGCGIVPEEAPCAFLRHATSKLRSEFDLEAIGTLGFRGEALAAIAAVSRVELLTRARGAELGTSLSLEGGTVLSQEEAGCPQGTTIVVRDLFYNTPARLKFMKKDAAEGAACFAAVQRTALSHPEVSVKFLRDGRQELLTPGDGLLQSALYAVLDRDLALGFIPVNGSGEEMSVSGFVSLPSCCRGTRGYQFFFVNGRHIKSRTMLAALEEAYANQKMVGKFPGCVLHLTCKLSTVDVNVHPTKQEVKFGSERRVFEAVYYAVLSALEADHTRPPAQGAPDRDKIPAGQSAGRMKAGAAGYPADRRAGKPFATGRGGFQTMTAQEFLKREGGLAAALPLHDITACQERAGEGATGRPNVPTARQEKYGLSRSREEDASKESGETGIPRERRVPAETPEELCREAEETELAEARSSGGGEASAVPPEPQLEAMPDPVSWRLAGEVLNTYIIVEQGDSVLFIDKHAAHERMNFDRLKAESYRPMVQALLTPVVFTPPPEEGAALLAHLSLLERFGFELEDFGGGALIVRAAPADVDAGEIEGALAELGVKLLATGRADPEAARDALLHTMACKAAIKGGQKNARQELLRVAQAVMDGQVKYCPHGRPVAVELTRRQLERRFGRT